MIRRYALALLIVVLTAALAACSSPSIPIPPTPTPNASVKRVAQSHQHGAGADGYPLITRYGGAVVSELGIATSAGELKPSVPFTATYRFLDKAGSPVTADKLLVTHERLMHMFVMSQDLKTFAHIHPEDSGGGDYSVQYTAPAPGKYVLFNTFTTQDGATQIERDVVEVGPKPAPDASAMLSPDLGVAKQVDDLTVVMAADVQKLRRRAPTSFTISVSENGTPVTDMQPFLGAAVHVVIASADTKQFAHTHGDVAGGAMSGDMSGMSMAGMAMPTPPPFFGPDLQFTYTFMQPGLYRMWLQFIHNGELKTLSYDLEISK